MPDETLFDPCQLEAGRPVVAGVSGGPDSLCLLHLLHTAGFPVVAAHYNHGLRAEAGEEAEAVAKLADRLGVPFTSETADVRGWADGQGMSIEEAARTLRYRFLFKTARLAQAQAVAVGHTADDQVETVLMHFLRGAGLAGLKGMLPRLVLPVFDPAIPLVRPLLPLWREETEAYCREHGLTAHYDASNADETYHRNRLRHTLIPELTRYNPRFKEALLHSALALQGDHALLEAEVARAWQTVVRASAPGWVVFERASLSACPPALQRHLFRRAGETLRPGSRDFGFNALERLVRRLADPHDGQVDFINGMLLILEGERVILSACEAALPAGDQPAVKGELPLTVGQTLPLGGGWSLSCRQVPPDPDLWNANPDPWSAWLDGDQAGETLLVRPCRPGDRFQPLGMGGQSVKVREFFINSKVPRRARQTWPLVCAGETIIWIPGLRLAHPCRVSEHTRRMLELRLKKEQAE